MPAGNSTVSKKNSGSTMNLRDQNQENPKRKYPRLENEQRKGAYEQKVRVFQSSVTVPRLSF